MLAGGVICLLVVCAPAAEALASRLSYVPSDGTGPITYPDSEPAGATSDG
jgi:hypothetical protein